MIVVDSSALIAILRIEPTALSLSERLEKEHQGARLVSVASYIETGTVLAGRRTQQPIDAMKDLDEFLGDNGIDLVPVDIEQGRIALRARIEYGRGFGSRAGLNYGDSFSYALAKAKSAPLLYVGNDFDKTDIVSALKTNR